MNREQKRIEMEGWKHSVNEPKRELMNICREVERLSASKAKRLDSIIGRLEA